MIWTLAGRSASFVPVLPTPGTCCKGGPELLLLGPLPSSLAATVLAVAGFAGCATRVPRRRAAVAFVVGLCFGAGRLRGASTWIGGRSVDLSCACVGAGTTIGSAHTSNAQPCNSFVRLFFLFGRVAPCRITIPKAPH